MDFVIDFIIEFFLEVFLDVVFHLTVENPKLKTWIKTMFFLLTTEPLAGLFLWMSFRITEWEGVLVCRIIALCFGLGLLVLAFFGHKRAWKQRQQ